MDFIQRLKDNDVEINHQLNALIKKNESGDTQNYTKFGREIFRQIERSEGEHHHFARSLSPATNMTTINKALLNQSPFKLSDGKEPVSNSNYNNYSFHPPNHTFRKPIGE